MSLLRAQGVEVKHHLSMHPVYGRTVSRASAKLLIMSAGTMFLTSLCL